MSCLNGIFDHSKHIIFSSTWKPVNFTKNPKPMGWVGEVRCLGLSPHKTNFSLIPSLIENQFNILGGLQINDLEAKADTEDEGGNR